MMYSTHVYYLLYAISVWKYFYQKNAMWLTNGSSFPITDTNGSLHHWTPALPVYSVQVYHSTLHNIGVINSCELETIAANNIKTDVM